MAGSSCEPGRRRAYGADLRWRMVWQRAVLGYTLQRVAANLCVDPSTVARISKQFEQTGTVCKKKYSSVGKMRKLSKPVQFAILHLVLKKPGIYLWEIQQEIFWVFGVCISASSLCTFLRKSNFRRKKMQHVASQQDHELRSIFLLEVSIYVSKFLIFIDETGCDRRNTLRKYGYGLRGKPVRCHKLLVRGERISVIAAMTVEGILELKVVHGTVDGDTFCSFIHKELANDVQWI